MGTYRVLLADPPWKYRNAGVEGAAERQYPTMTIAELCALPIAALAAPDAVLLLWATWPLLDEAIGVLRAWGFEYVTGLPWVKLEGDPQRNLWGDYEYKPQYGTGFWVRGCSEPLLIGRRGDIARPIEAGNTLGIVSENFGHSRKPENLYEYAEHFEGPYLELFARRPRQGWAVYGNQVERSSALGAA
jgi:N6-adenosine-specific RNA methylase IME4